MRRKPTTGASTYPGPTRRQRLLGRLARRISAAASYSEERLLHVSLARFGARHALEIPTWTREDELCALHDLACACPDGASALEIGAYLGASSCVIAAGLAGRGGHLFCVDTWQNETMPEGVRDTFSIFQRNTAPFASMITPLRKRSDQLSAAEVRRPLDLAFIDGDHAYEAVASDFDTIEPWMARDGVIVFHDVGAIEHTGVGRVVGAALASGGWTLGGLVRSLAWLVRYESVHNPAADPDGIGSLRAALP